MRNDWSTEKDGSRQERVSLTAPLRQRIAAAEGAVYRQGMGAVLSVTKSNTLSVLILRGLEAVEAETRPAQEPARLAPVPIPPDMRKPA